MKLNHLLHKELSLIEILTLCNNYYMGHTSHYFKNADRDP